MSWNERSGLPWGQGRLLMLSVEKGVDQGETSLAR
jgi:hypothetical protein